MNLREKVIKGFVHSYIENEKNIVRNLLQTGRIGDDEWSQISQQLEELTEKYENNEITADEYLKQRKQVRKEFTKSREKDEGMPREHAEALYDEIKEQQKDTLETAMINSSISTITVLGKILSSRMRFITARLKNI